MLSLTRFAETVKSSSEKGGLLEGGGGVKRGV